MLDEMLALATSVCLLALSHSDRRVRASLLCAWLVALCCAALDARRQRARSRSWVGFCDLSRSRLKLYVYEYELRIYSYA